MGYRSDVQVMTNLEGFEKMQEIIWQLAKERGITTEGSNYGKEFVPFPDLDQDPDDVFDMYDAQEDYLCFGFDFVKWYDTYTSVILFMDMLTEAGKAGVPWQFIRVGEENGDVEELYSENFYDEISYPMYITTTINY